ncbi:AAA family ATPase [Mesorhizobium sp. WSM3224]|uniref:AAA family ATPase n=1 Tax=Mesorhizobium sp. WSM3224 TaxID=1040986 RepID=UPI0004263023|nr:AAA family ATPase [Mesorhizobium sp. WSM3224]
MIWPFVTKQTEPAKAAEQVCDTWVEKLELDLSASTVGDLGSVADPTLELAQSMVANAGSEAFRSEAREFVLKTIADLPPDARGFAGKDESGLEQFLDDLLARGGDLVTARLKARCSAMRLRRLELARYGKFTDKAIDFGEEPVSGPDLHIVFGLNEAGKSTALSAYLDLLFGIEERSRYSFLHEYSSMRIGGPLEFEDARLPFPAS